MLNKVIIITYANVSYIFNLQEVTSESFDQIDEFYKLITPNPDDEKPMKEQQRSASEHIVKFINSNSGPVVGTTCIFVVLESLVKLIEGINHW